MSTFEELGFIQNHNGGFVLNRPQGRGFCTYRSDRNVIETACQKENAKNYSHCDKHRCHSTFEVCPRTPINGFKYCDRHNCEFSSSHPCPSQVEDKPFGSTLGIGYYRPSYCMNHRCAVWKTHTCNYKIYRDDARYCEAHTCKEAGCLEFRGFDEYCTDHKCQYERGGRSRCDRRRKDGIDKCELHEHPERVCERCKNGLIAEDGNCTRCYRA